MFVSFLGKRVEDLSTRREAAQRTLPTIRHLRLVLRNRTTEICTSTFPVRCDVHADRAMLKSCAFQVRFAEMLGQTSRSTTWTTLQPESRTGEIMTG